MSALFSFFQKAGDVVPRTPSGRVRLVGFQNRSFNSTKKSPRLVCNFL